MHQRGEALDKLAPVLGLRSPSWQPGLGDASSPTIKAAAVHGLLADPVASFCSLPSTLSGQLASQRGASLEAYSLPPGGGLYPQLQEQEALALHQRRASSLGHSSASSLPGSLDSQVHSHAVRPRPLAAPSRPSALAAAPWRCSVSLGVTRDQHALAAAGPGCTVCKAALAERASNSGQRAAPGGVAGWHLRAAAPPTICFPT